MLHQNPFHAEKYVIQYPQIHFNISDIIKIRDTLGITLYYEYDNLLEISPRITQELFDINTILLSMKL